MKKYIEVTWPESQKFMGDNYGSDDVYVLGDDTVLVSEEAYYRDEEKSVKATRLVEEIKNEAYALRGMEIHQMVNESADSIFNVANVAGIILEMIPDVNSDDKF